MLNAVLVFKLFKSFKGISKSVSVLIEEGVIGRLVDLTRKLKKCIRQKKKIPLIVNYICAVLLTSLSAHIRFMKFFNFIFVFLETTSDGIFVLLLFIK